MSVKKGEEEMERYLFQNAEIIFPTGIRPGQVLTENGKIKQIFEKNQPVAPAPGVRVVDARGMYLSPV